MHHFLTGLWLVMKTGFYMRAGDDQFSGWTEKKLQSTSLPKPDLHQKKVMVTVGWSASGLMHSSFLNPGETVTSEKYTEQFSETHRKPQCLQLPLVNRKGPVLLSSTQMHITQPTHPKLNRLGSKVCLICHIHLTSSQLTTASSISTAFCRETTSTTSKRQKMLLKSSLNLEAQIFMLQE